MTGKYMEPFAGVVDSQSVKSIGQKRFKGFDGHGMPPKVAPGVI